ncbi:MAG: hypothetical protein WBE13_02420 [Candidatus Acidiferrum sp.]
MEWLFSWEVTSVVVAFFATSGQGFIALKDYKLAKTCFLIAAADAIGGVAMAGTKSHLAPLTTAILVFVSSGVIGLMALQALKYADTKKEEEIAAIRAEKERLFGELSAEEADRKYLYNKLFGIDTNIQILEQERRTNNMLNPATKHDAFRRQENFIKEHDEAKKDVNVHEVALAKTLAQIRLRFPGSDTLVDAAAKPPIYEPAKTMNGMWSGKEKEAWVHAESSRANSILLEQGVKPIETLLQYMQGHLN